MVKGWTMRSTILLIFIFICVLSRDGIALSLHIGDASVPLSITRNTSPSLAVGIGNTVYFGALFTDVAPTGTLRINISGTQYWLGEYCAPGTYLPPGEFRCIDCGLGHYCTGGRHRAACSGGIIGCPGTRASADVAAPKFANRLLTADEITANVTPTDLSQWRQISCCATAYEKDYDTLHNDLSLVNTAQGCANNTLSPGTYLFTVRTTSFCNNSVDPLSGHALSAFSANMLIFDHDVSYKTIHASGVYYHFVDTDGPEFTNWDFHVPQTSFCTNDLRANVDGLNNVPRVMCVYELQ